MASIYKSPLNGVQVDKRLIETINILDSIKQLKEYTERLTKLGQQLNYDPLDREVIIIHDNEEGDVRIDMKNLADLDDTAIGTKIKLYFDEPDANETLMNLVVFTGNSSTNDINTEVVEVLTDLRKDFSKLIVDLEGWFEQLVVFLSLLHTEEKQED